jgi:hypothetical protein
MDKVFGKVCKIVYGVQGAMQAVCKVEYHPTECSKFTGVYGGSSPTCPGISTFFFKQKAKALR